MVGAQGLLRSLALIGIADRRPKVRLSLVVEPFFPGFSSRASKTIKKGRINRPFLMVGAQGFEPWTH